MYVSSKPSTHRHHRAEIPPPYSDKENEGGTYRAHTRTSPRCMHRKASRGTPKEGSAGRTYAFTIDNDRARVSKLYSLFRADPFPPSPFPFPLTARDWISRIQRKKNKNRTTEGRGRRKRETGTVKRYLSHELREESMSTAVNYDKCRDCDAAISEVPPTPYRP